MKKSICLGAFVAFIGVCNAQNPNVPTNEVTDLSKLDLSVNDGSNLQVLTKASDYFGFDNEITKRLINQNDIKKAPKSNGQSNKNAYKEILNKWITDNKSLIKPEFHNNPITE
jgi:hypothetical protein